MTPLKLDDFLKKLDWSRQKPQAKARQQDGHAVAQWKQERVAELKKAQRERCVILYVDESAATADRLLLITRTGRLFIIVKPSRPS